jgi:hypothetical protein
MEPEQSEDLRTLSAPRPKREALALRSGDRIRVADGSWYSVIDNPADGVWLVVAGVLDDISDEQMILLADVIEIVTRPTSREAEE